MKSFLTKIMESMRTIALVILATTLLLLYAWLAQQLISAALSCNQAAVGNISRIAESLTTPVCNVTLRVSTLVHTLQGLVSAVVIAVLATTPPNAPFNLKFFGMDSAPSIASNFAQCLALAYLVIWLVVGGASLIVGHVVINEELVKNFQTLIDLGSAWFGLAVAATYAFFGIKPASVN
jgi:hypothetical protein